MQVGTIHLVNFIKDHENWKALLSQAPYNLKITEENDYAIFKYNQVCSDFALPVVREARGCIIHPPTLTYVCRAFDKFGNFGESYVEDLDWSAGVSVQEKIDGSLMKLWYHDNSWHVSTNGTIDAYKSPTNNLKYRTFGELFDAAFTKVCDKDKIDEYFDRNYTYMFELVSPYNRVVIPYKDINLYYLGRRDMRTLHEESPAEWKPELSFLIPKVYQMKTLEDVIAAAAKLQWDSEGYVCVDRDFKRCKIKSPAYVLAHYARANNSISLSTLVEVVLCKEQKAFLTYADDFATQLIAVDEAINAIAEEAISDWRDLYRATTGYGNRKDFAQRVCKKNKYVQDFLFKTFDTQIFFVYAKDWSVDKWCRVVEMYAKDHPEKELLNSLLRVSDNKE